MLNIQCWHPTRTAHLVVSKISTNLCRSSRPNWSALIRSKKKKKKNQPRTSMVEPQLTILFKILGPSLLGMMSTTHSIHSNVRPAPFPVWGFIMTDDCHILSAQAQGCSIWLCTWTKRRRVIQSLTKLNNRI